MHNFQAMLLLLQLHHHSHFKGLMFKLNLFLRFKLRLAKNGERIKLRPYVSVVAIVTLLAPVHLHFTPKQYSVLVYQL